MSLRDTAIMVGEVKRSAASIWHLAKRLDTLPVSEKEALAAAVVILLRVWCSSPGGGKTN